MDMSWLKLKCNIRSSSESPIVICTERHSSESWEDLGKICDRRGSARGASNYSFLCKLDPRLDRRDAAELVGHFYFSAHILSLK